MGGGGLGSLMTSGGQRHRKIGGVHEVLHGIILANAKSPEAQALESGNQERCSALLDGAGVAVVRTLVKPPF